MTKKEFVLLALEEVETNPSKNIDYVKFWENQYDSFVNYGITPDIHNFTITHLKILEKEY